jgi:phosphoribosylanthranilate isomerase
VSSRIKFCGCTSPADAQLARDAGADAFGLIFAPSPRRISWESAREIAAGRPAGITPAGVFVNPAIGDIERFRSLFPDGIVQLSGDETPEFVAAVQGSVIKVVHIEGQTPQDLEAVCNRYAPALVMFDTKAASAYGGTGTTFAWENVAAYARWHPVFVAGGLTPENVGDCVRSVRPFGVDVRSGIESDGRKDVEKMRRFVRAVRESDAT